MGDDLWGAYSGNPVTAFTMENLLSIHRDTRAQTPMQARAPAAAPSTTLASVPPAQAAGPGPAPAPAPSPGQAPAPAPAPTLVPAPTGATASEFTGNHCL